MKTVPRPERHDKSLLAPIRDGVMGLARFCIQIVFACCALATLLNYLGDRYHAFELLTHFRLQYLGVSLISGAALMLLSDSDRRRLWVLPILLLTALNGLPVIPYYVPNKPVESANGPSLRVLNANVLISNTQYERLAQLIQREAPDLVALEEVDATWLTVLEPTLHHSYPYRKLVPLDSPFGIALYSKLPLSGVQVKFFGNAYRGRLFPSILAQVRYGGQKTLSVLVTHPLPPMSGFEVRNSQLADIAAQRAGFGNNLVVVGDLNISQWSPYFSRFIAATGLRDSQRGFGVQPSWPADIPLLRVPIDHVLVSPGIAVLNRRLGPDIGSDHLPVIADLQVP